ncbi:hypothetical protein EVG20_g380 [Dentipellis fragilis]|uniref:G-patch domain-containing protein n=1 Tax=Dentipellis fragilis TaxID=205917 RepID=A0A4Y9ZEP6_9AGAM|nr:hypothetical protein EVG20_g380 [Dentipellis fragilis]
MSAQTIARWNAIPMNRPEPDDQRPSAGSLKRTRGDDNDTSVDDQDSDDDVSLVSRTPSPPPPGKMDVDKYDEYVRGRVAPETITVDTKIKGTNKGFAMLAKLGWSEGQPLGLSSEGRVDPVPFHVKRDLTGLGKTSQDVRMIETTVSQRRGLDSERQQKETEEQRRQREDSVARRAAVQTEISETLRAFYCTVCDKQFQNVAQYDEHTNSYAHHHKVRFRDMQLAQRQKQNTQEEIDKRKEKERKREEKQLRKMAAAAGIKMAKPAAVVPVEEPQPSGSAASGWSTAAPVAAEPTPPKSGWAPVSAVAPPVPPRWASASAPRETPQSVPFPPPDAPPMRSQQPAPAFRTGGWSSLDTTSQPPPPVPATTPLPPPMPNQQAAQGWAPQQPTSDNSFPTGAWLSRNVGPPIRPSTERMQPPLPRTPQVSEVPMPSSSITNFVATPSKGPTPAPKKDDKREKGRSGWQAFQRGGRRK